MQAILDQQIAQLNEEQLAFISPRLIPLRKMILNWEYGDCEPYESWVFAEFGERKVGAAYCLGGFGALGSPWGLIFTNENWFGMDAGWYQSLSELISDGWIGDWIRAES